MSVTDAPIAPPAPSWVSQRPRRRTLLWLVVVSNASVLLVALVLLASTPFTVSWPANLREAVVLGIAVGGTLVIQALLVRRVLGPLGALWQHMHRVDPLNPGQRIDVRARSVEVSDLVEAFNAMLDRLEEERRESARRAQAAQDAERRWLSLELHDQIGQDLTALQLNIDVARRVDGQRRDQALASAAETAADCVERVRSIVGRLRPAVLDELGLSTALVQLCERIAATSGLRIARTFEHDLPLLTSDAQLGVFRVAQESLTNIVRHSGATKAEMRLTAHDGGVRLVVSDDGLGISARDARNGSGIRGMRERALLLGAPLTFSSRTPRGTTVTLDIPRAEVADPMPSPERRFLNLVPPAKDTA